MKSYTTELIARAKKLDEFLTVDYDEISFRYRVYINMVFYTEKTSYWKSALIGNGYTIEDACMDYIRKARAGRMVHVINNKELEAV